jgi:hypothetical protein
MDPDMLVSAVSRVLLGHCQSIAGKRSNNRKVVEDDPTDHDERE